MLQPYGWPEEWDNDWNVCKIWLQIYAKSNSFLKFIANNGQTRRNQTSPRSMRSMRSESAIKHLHPSSLWHGLVPTNLVFFFAPCFFLPRFTLASVCRQPYPAVCRVSTGRQVNKKLVNFGSELMLLFSHTWLFWAHLHNSTTAHTVILSNIV